MSTVLEKIKQKDDFLGDYPFPEKKKENNKGKNYDKHQLKPGSDKFLNDLVNKVVACETMSGKIITGVLIGYDTYTLLVVEPKDIKNPNPKRTVIFKHGLVSICEA
jgi:small nuclear ribonucleoprotein (snRNP)-like protein